MPTNDPTAPEPRTRDTVSVRDIGAKLPLEIWRGLYDAAARTDAIPVVRVRDGSGKEFVVIEARFFYEMQDEWSRRDDTSKQGES
jgi:hypothetical protein